MYGVVLTVRFPISDFICLSLTPVSYASQLIVRVCRLCNLLFWVKFKERWWLCFISFLFLLPPIHSPPKSIVHTVTFNFNLNSSINIKIKTGSTELPTFQLYFIFPKNIVIYICKPILWAYIFSSSHICFSMDKSLLLKLFYPIKIPS